jgi:hypothetical protein
MRTLAYALIILVLLSTMACGATGSGSVPQATVQPITIGNDLTAIDLCQAIPREAIEAVMSRKLIGTPQRFEYYDAAGTSGCTYDAGKDSSGEAHFGYVALTPVDVYANQPLYQQIDVSGIGESAYFNNGADARQLWVKANDRVAFVVAFGDRPNEEGARTIARLIIAAIR